MVRSWASAIPPELGNLAGLKRLYLTLNQLSGAIPPFLGDLGNLVNLHLAGNKFSGGILNARTLANADCLGTGPKGRVRVGRKVAYPVDSLIEWMQAKMEVVK